jgi:selenocysteine lyase/cysteine desulfurase
LKSSLEPRHRSQILSIGSPAGEELARYLLQEGIFLVYREGGVRVAVNFYNTMEEIDFLIERLETFKRNHVSSSRSAVK